MGRVGETDKLVFRQRDVSIQKSRYITSIFRYVLGDGRRDTIAGISSTLDDLENVISECSKTDIKILTNMDKYLLLSRCHDDLRPT